MKRRMFVILLVVVAVVLVVLASALPSFPVAAQVGPAVMFSASVDPAVAGQNHTITVTMSDTNLLPFANEPTDDAAYTARNLTGVPCGETYPMGVALYQGRYTLQNLSAKSYLPVVDEFTYWFCGPTFVGAPFKLAPFWTDTQTMGLAGYWTAGETRYPDGGVSMGVLHPFAPGEYTLVTGDAWGHVQVLYFRVV
jgi:hypothetical protein